MTVPYAAEFKGFVKLYLHFLTRIYNAVLKHNGKVFFVLITEV
jgi:hypothetical protein